MTIVAKGDPSAQASNLRLLAYKACAMGIDKLVDWQWAGFEREHGEKKDTPLKRRPSARQSIQNSRAAACERNATAERAPTRDKFRMVLFSVGAPPANCQNPRVRAVRIARRLITRRRVPEQELRVFRATTFGRTLY
jgi:hypothetical protein